MQANPSRWLTRALVLFVVLSAAFAARRRRA
jgi:hypothetical protein